jgi:pimeloyl-ACP methyl ester carboxylesterase
MTSSHDTDTINTEPHEVDTAMTTMRMLQAADADIAYDVDGPLPAADGRPPLLMVGQPLCAPGFATLASHFPERTVVTYDPRGLGRSTRRDGRLDHAPTVQAEDLHALIEALDAGAVEMFASSGGAVTALALIAAYPDDVTTLVAHEPPLIPVLPDAAAAERALARVRDTYEAEGSGAGMAAFVAMTSWRGEFTDEYFDQPPADPVLFGMPTEDDGFRDDPVLSDRSSPVSSYRPDVNALAAARARVIIAVGEGSLNTFTGRTAVATAEILGQQATVFPSHHRGFLGGESGPAGQPEAFARKLREVLDACDGCIVEGS